jgi:hypothetical protein
MEPAQKGTRLDDFFKRYEGASAANDPEIIASFYTGSFFVAGPQGSATFNNDDSFIAWLRGVAEFNRGVGLKLTFEGIADERRLSPVHTLAVVRWSARFAGVSEPAEFRIAYLVEDLGEPKILGYVSEDDQDARMKEMGIV